MHNHLGGPRRLPLTIEGLPIEDGHGCMPVEWQLAQHIARIRLKDGDDCAVALFKKLRTALGVNQRLFDAQLVRVGFMAEATAAAAAKLDAYEPGGPAN
jgi:hypothetical protein